MSVVPSKNTFHTHGESLTTENHKVLSTHRHEPGKLVAEDLLNLVRLLDGDGHADRVDRRLDENLLHLVTRHDERLEEDLGRSPVESAQSPALLRQQHSNIPSLDLRLVMPLDDLGRKVLQREGRSERCPHSVEVRPESVGLACQCELNVYIKGTTHHGGIGRE